MICLVQKINDFHCYFRNKRTKKPTTGRYCFIHRAYWHPIQTSVEILSKHIIDKKIMLFCFIACTCWALTARSADEKSRTNTSAAEHVSGLMTSDGVPLQVVYYPSQGKATATVILVHDIGGSEKTVRKLASGLQQAGCAVAVPDLRGHGASKRPDLDVSKKNLPANQLQMIPDENISIS